MSRAAVVQFCQRIAKSPELQSRLESGVKAGAGWELLVSAGHEHGFSFTDHEAAECFEHERLLRVARESADHAETRILKQAPVIDPRIAETLILGRGENDVMSVNGLRRIALSHDWNIGASDTAAAEDESIFS